MMTAEDVGRVMLVVVPLILGIVAVGFIAFIRWSRKDRGVED